MLDLVASGFLVTCRKNDSEPAAIPTSLSGFHSNFLFRRGRVSFFPPFASFFTPQIQPINQTQFPALWIGGYSKKNRRSDFFEGYCTFSTVSSLPPPQKRHTNCSSAPNRI
jgi:hypothetical protein